jgi:hypothetical protein
MNTNIFAACLNSSLILQNVSQELARLCHCLRQQKEKVASQPASLLVTAARRRLLGIKQINNSST